MKPFEKVSLLELLEQERKFKYFEQDAKNRYYRQIGKLINFIEQIESMTSDFDDFCDCENRKVHEKNCLTMAMRRDMENATKFEEVKDGN